ncbi:MAG: tetratricopeptide repeat protein [Bacteroidaceae bacterium]|nr:tetratricopeptide repeat protein [Bacteroidaceae bacterium]
MKALPLIFLFLLVPFSIKGQTNTDGVITIGRNALYYEDYALSIQYFNQAIQAKPYLYEPYFYRAVAKYYLGDYPGAIEDCSASIERDPFIDDCYKLRAINYIMTNQFSLAVKDYRHLIAQQIDDKDYWYNMVLCQVQLDSLQEADLMLDTMLVKWPQYSRCYLLKAQIAVQRKDTVAADTLLDHALRISPFEVEAWAAKAMICMQQNKFSEAENAYDHAILQKPKEAGFYINRALSRYHQDNLRGAMDDYDIALDIEPDNYLGHYNRGLLRMQVGENNLAITDFDFVLLKQPNDRLALFNRATLLETTGDMKGAIRDYSTVLEQYPNFLTGYEHRAKCYRAIGDTKHAVADERKVFIARLDETYGSSSRKPQPATTRKQKEQDIDDYQALVVDNNDESLAKFYSSDYRGRVQNRDISIELQPLFILTLNRVSNGLSNQLHYAHFLEELNQHATQGEHLYLSSREAPSNADEIQAIRLKAEQLARQLAEAPQSAQLLFLHALLLSFERNYSESLADLNQALHLDSTHQGALFLRAAVRSRLADVAQISETTIQEKAHAGIPVSHPSSFSEQEALWRMAIDDINAALRQDPQCPYYLYNRACLHSKLREKTEAIDDFTQAIKWQPQLAEAYYNRGLLEIDQQDFKSGFDDLSKAGELGLYSAYSLIKHFRKVQKNIDRQKQDAQQ